jgi:hypothetical protein
MNASVLPTSPLGTPDRMAEMATAQKNLELVKDGLARGIISPEEVQDGLKSLAKRTADVNTADNEAFRQKSAEDTQRVMTALQVLVATNANGRFESNRQFKDVIQNFAREQRISIYPSGHMAFMQLQDADLARRPNHLKVTVGRKVFAITATANQVGIYERSERDHTVFWGPCSIDLPQFAS